MTVRQENNGRLKPLGLILSMTASVTLFALLAVVYNKERVLALLRQRNQREVALKVEFAEFTNEWKTRSTESKDHPKFGSERALVEWVFDNVASRKQRCTHIAAGIDSWGNRISISVSTRKIGQDVEATMVVRSFGPNGLDEGGNGDDIVVQSGTACYRDGE